MGHWTWGKQACTGECLISHASPLIVSQALPGQNHMMCILHWLSIMPKLLNRFSDHSRDAQICTLQMHAYSIHSVNLMTADNNKPQEHL